MKVTAAVLYAPGAPLEISTVDLQGPRPGEVQIKVKAVGVCHSDWHLMSGATKHPLPCVLGHEGSGVVEAVGEGVTSVRIGDHVSLNWAPYCGQCFFCTHERPSLCEAYDANIWAGTMPDGTSRLSRNGQTLYHYSALACLAERCVIHEASCVVMPNEVPFPILAVIGCAVTTGVGSVLHTAKVQRHSSVVVFGAGGVGLSTIMGAKVVGADTVIAVDTSIEKLELAQTLGATHGLLWDDKIVQKIKALTDGRGADYVFEAIGSLDVQRESIRSARKGGMVVFSGLAPMGSAIPLETALLTREEKTLTGSYYGSARADVDFPNIARMYQEGKMLLDGLVTRQYVLDDVNTAFRDLLSGAAGRGIILLPD
jgi:S-(hydroxymethyl)glutathione dehydrogenase / alcohol dehydrogenase